jgi:Tfp pilus assembly protein PilX
MKNRCFLKKYSKSPDQKGAVLVTGLLLLLVLTILGMAAMLTTGMELKIARNDRSAKRVFYVTEAGTEDARSRLQSVGSTSPIPDNQPTNANWKAFIGPAPEAALEGYVTGDSNHVLYPPLNSSPDGNYLVTITHKKNSSGQILKWGYANGILGENTSAGNNIFVIKSHGQDTNGASKSVQIEATNATLYAPAAVYARGNTTMQGTSTYVQGKDQCGPGDGSSDVYGVLSKKSVTQNGNPFMDGSPKPVEQNSPVEIPIQDLVKQFKSYANYTYNIVGQTMTGVNWGSPTPGATPEDAMSCNTQNVVYINTSSTFVQLTGQGQGCGLLLVDGDLMVQGGFHWYGVILVTGSVSFTGGAEKNVTGALLAGADASADLVGGNASIPYCSRAVYENSHYLPLKIVRWVELFS